jgi:hypothetical protein
MNLKPSMALTARIAIARAAGNRTNWLLGRHWFGRGQRRATQNIGELKMVSCTALRRGLLLAILLAAPVTALGETAAPPNAAVYFISPKDGDTVTSPFKVQFGLSGMGVAPAGVEKPNTGHHHLIIDATLSPEELTAPIASDTKHIHFGGGQTETMVTLPPGEHTLQLVLGDWTHIPFNPPIMSPAITVTVK